MKKVIGYTESCVGHGASSSGRTDICLLYEDGSYGPGAWEPKGIPCLASYERAASGRDSGVTLGDFLDGYLSRGNWRDPEIVKVARQFWAARKKYLAASDREMKKLAIVFAQEIRRFLRANVARSVETTPTAGWFENAQKLGGRLAKVAALLSRRDAEWEYKAAQAATGLTTEEYEDFLALLAVTDRQREWWHSRPWSKSEAV